VTLRRRRTATQEAGRVLSSRDMFKILFPPKAKFDAQVGREWRELDPAPLLEAMNAGSRWL
jgi:hypothetical protein